MKTIPLTIFLVLGPLMAAVSVVRGGGLPQAPTVEAQPLLLQTERLVEAMASVGAPIDSGRLERLQALQQETDDAVITRGVQAELDALSIAAIVVAADGSISARPRGEPVILDISAFCPSNSRNDFIKYSKFVFSTSFNFSNCSAI